VSYLSFVAVLELISRGWELLDCRIWAASMGLLLSLADTRHKLSIIDHTLFYTIAF